MVYKYWHGEGITERKGLFHPVENGITGSRAWKLKPDKGKLEIRHGFITLGGRRRGEEGGEATEQLCYGCGSLSLLSAGGHD